MNRINLDVRQLQALIAVAEEGSFSAAASRVFLSQPALSLQVKHLEESLELKLFHRTTRKVELTPAGQELLVTARRVIAELDEGIAQLRDYSECRRGRVAVAVLPSLASTLLAEAIPGFRRKLPGIRVGVRDGVADAVIEALKAGEVDLALGLPMQAEEEFAMTHLLMDRLVALARPEQFDPPRARLTWTELSRHPLVAMARGTSIRRLTDQAFGQLHLHPKLAYEVSYMSTAIALVENGEGIAVLPSSAMPRTLPPHLLRLEVDAPTVERQICILERKGRYRSPAAESLIQYLLEFTAGWREGPHT